MAIIVSKVLIKIARPARRLTPFGGLATGLILAGIYFGSKARLLGYGLLAGGAVLAVVDIIKKKQE